MLRALLLAIGGQQHDGLFSHSVVVVDNDPLLSARDTVEAVRKEMDQDTLYVPLPNPNIALARNRAVEASTGDYVAFIDDDEYPGERWLIELVKAIDHYKASAVLGPVLPHYDVSPPVWVTRGKLCERPRYTTGTRLLWKQTRTGNVLLRKVIFTHEGFRFNPVYGILGGEDITFFKALLRDGTHSVVWCDEAVVFEHVPNYRMAAKWFLRRAYIRGHVSFGYYRREMTLLRRAIITMKSLAALSVYTIIFPIMAMLGFHIGMRYLVKMVQHFAHINAALGIQSPNSRKL